MPPEAGDTPAPLLAAAARAFRGAVSGLAQAGQGLRAGKRPAPAEEGPRPQAEREPV